MKNLKIDKINSLRFNSGQLSEIKGGDVGGCHITCVCGCRYENQGGSTTSANYSANDSSQLQTPGWDDN